MIIFTFFWWLTKDLEKFEQMYSDFYCLNAHGKVEQSNLCTYSKLQISACNLTSTLNKVVTLQK